MSRKLVSPDQPLPIRILLGLYEFCASLKLAVVLITAVAFSLMAATVIESNYGAAGAHWYCYQSPWFLILHALLALNIFSAAAIRYPWKRHQTGFVITHIGLLTLLAGSALSYRGAVNSQMLVYLNESSSTAVDHDFGYLVVDGLKMPGKEADGDQEAWSVPLKMGPFNWSDGDPLLALMTGNRLGRGEKHPPETLYQDDKTKIELIDYYARSEARLLPYVELDFTQPVFGLDVPVELEWNRELNCALADFQGIGSLTMWQAANADQFAGFTKCVPDRTVEGDGLVTIWTPELGEDGAEQLTVGKLQAAAESKTPIEITETLSVELVKFAPSANLRALVSTGSLISDGDEPVMPAVELRLIRKSADSSEQATERVIRFAELPFAKRTLEKFQDIVVDYYHPKMKGRIDILEGGDDKLAYRVWQQKLARIVAAGPLEFDEPVDTWSMGGRGGMQKAGAEKSVWRMTLVRHEPDTEDAKSLPDGSRYNIFPLPFDKDNTERGSSRRIKVRVSAVADPSQKAEFWLRQNAPEPWVKKTSWQSETVALDGLPEIKLHYEMQQTDIGFSMHLDKFDLRVDPGAAIASNYTSEVTVVPGSAESESRGTPQKFVITMNAPLDYPDPQGRTLRFFQENYLPPRSDEPLGSIFRVNYDPGRWVKYLGSLLVCVGIFAMFYMRAYFFKPVRKVSETTAAERRAAHLDTAAVGS